MKKVIGIVLAAIFLTTGIAAATDFTLSGSYYARGQWFDNVGGKVDGAEAFGNWDNELSVDATWQIDDSTKVFARFEIRDEVWGTETNEAQNIGVSYDENIYVEQVWGAYKFAATGGTLSVGLMSAGAWGTAFFDAGYDAYRVKYVQPTAIGTLIGVYQKIAENGIVTAADDDRTDVDAYIVGLITKAGPVKLMPLFVYVDHEIGDGNKYEIHFAATGDLGAVSFEAEAIYADHDEYGAAGTIDGDIWGLYAKASFNAGPATINILGAYGDYNDSDNIDFSFKDDFEAGGAMILGDDMELVGADLGNGYLLAVSASFAATDELTLGAYLGYWAADEDWTDQEADLGDDTDAVEVSVSGSYALTANLTYSLGLGWAQLDTDGFDYDSSLNAYHKLSFSF